MRYSLSALALISAALGGCTEGVLDPKGPIGNSNAIILLDAVGIMCVIVVPTMATISSSPAQNDGKEYPVTTPTITKLSSSEFCIRQQTNHSSLR